MVFLTCRAGHRHWGRYGAAGLLLVDCGRVLLQQRSGFVHHGGTWSIPGGAIERGETPTAAALREAGEEAGVTPASVQVFATSEADCGGWRYTTVLARALSPVRIRRTSGLGEAARHEWVPIDGVPSLPLHEGFRASWSSALAPLARSHTGSTP